MSKNTNNKIIKIVENQLDALKEQFKKNPTLFFTENDLVCTFHRLLYQALEDNGKKTGHNGEQHSLIHCEYPTPFRCSMKDKEANSPENRYTFELKDKDTDPTGWTGYNRGHFDIVVLSPEFVRREFSDTEGNDLSFDIIKAQDIHDYEEHVIDNLSEIGTVIEMGIEFVYRRKPITKNAVKTFIDEVCQDLAKLEATCRYPETRKHNKFMKNAHMVAFVKGTAPDQHGPIEKGLKKKIREKRFQGLKKMKLNENRVTIVFDNASRNNDSSD